MARCVRPIPGIYSNSRGAPTSRLEVDFAIGPRLDQMMSNGDGAGHLEVSVFTHERSQHGFAGAPADILHLAGVDREVAVRQGEGEQL